MTSLAVPERHRETLTQLAKTTKTTVDQLVAALGGTFESRYVSREELIATAETVLGSDGPLDASLVTDVLLTISSARTRVHPQSAESFASDVAKAQNLDLSSKQRTALCKRLTALLSIEAVIRSAKVVDLADEHQRIFHTARIMTDIRPVFADDPTQQPDGAITFHVLKLESFIAGRVEDVFVALDDGDLRDLKFAVDRAIDKAETLASYLDTIGLSRFKTEGDRE